MAKADILRIGKYNPNNHRTSYHVVLTFDLIKPTDNGVYQEIKEDLKELGIKGLKADTYMAESEGSEKISLPNNTFAGIWKKEFESSNVKKYVESCVTEIFDKYKDKFEYAKYFVIVADNWSVGGKKVPEVN